MEVHNIKKRKSYCFGDVIIQTFCAITDLFRSTAFLILKVTVIYLFKFFICGKKLNGLFLFFLRPSVK